MQRYQGLTGKFSQSVSNPGVMNSNFTTPHPQNIPSAPQPHDNSSYHQIQSCYRTPFQDKSDALNRLELFISLDIPEDTPVGENTSQEEEINNVYQKISKIQDTTADICFKMTQKQTEEVYLMEKLQHFAAIREKQQAQQTQQSNRIHTSVPSWNNN